MAILTSSQLTFVDITDQKKISSYITSNLTTVQIYDSDSDTYSPDWTNQSKHLVLTPNIFLDQSPISLTDKNLHLTWTQKDGNGNATGNITGGSILNNVLTINQNALSSTTSDMITYICTATYTDSETNLESTPITSQITYTLVRTATNAKTCSINGAQVFKYNAEGILDGSNKLTLSGFVQNVSIVKWQYFDKNSSKYLDYPIDDDNTSNTGTSLIVNAEKEIVFQGESSVQIRLLTSDADVYDIITISKLYDGQKGQDGNNGAAGKSAYTILLTNESHTFPGDVLYANQGSSASTNVIAYQGTDEKTATITKIGDAAVSESTTTISPVSGMTCKLTGNNTIKPSITFTISTSTFTEQSGSIPILLTVDGVEFTKTFSWSVAYTGIGACSLSIAASSQIFKSSDGSIFTPTTIQLTPIVQNLQLGNCTWYYSVDGGTSWIEIIDTSSGISPWYENNTSSESYKTLTIPNSATCFTGTNGSVVFKCVNGDYYDTMTISKLSDGQSAAAAYTVVLSNELQSIPVDLNLVPLAKADYKCAVHVYEGSTQLSAIRDGSVSEGSFKIVIPSSPKGMTISLSKSDPSVVEFGVTNTTSIGSSGNIELSIQIESEDNIVTKSIAYVVSRVGDSSVVFAVFAPNGTVFTDPEGTLTLDTTRYYGSTEIPSESATYQWAKYNATNGWENIADATSSTLTVNPAGVVNIASYRCTMTYNGIDYLDIITLEDKFDTCVSEMLTVGGTTFKNGQGGSGVYVIIRSNGKELDPFPGGIAPSIAAPINPSSGSYWYDVDHNTKSILPKQYDGSKWNDIPSIPQIYTYTWSLMDKDGNNVESFNKTGKVIYLSCDDISSIGTLHCAVTKTES